MANSKKKSKGSGKAFLIITGGVLVTALTVCALLLLGHGGAADETQRVIELGTAMKGVSVGGVDISGMTRDEALAATAALSARLLEKVSVTVDVAGTSKVLTAADLALTTDYDAVIGEAMAYGRTGSFEARLAAAQARRHPASISR
jgi:hypothetical protein